MRVRLLTNDPAVEAAMRAACDALLAGDIMTAMGYLTPQAIMEAMTIGSGIATMPTPTGYTIDSHEEAAGEHRFGVRFQTDQGDIRARVAWQQVEGAWKVTSLQVEAR